MSARVDLRHPQLQSLLRAQCGVLSRRQLRAAGASDGDIARMRRRMEIRAAHPGVYVDHTGPLAHAQREWVAVLAAWPGLPDSVLDALGRRSRIAGRSMIESLVTDLRDGACSVLERGYLHRVERATAYLAGHGRSRARRPADARWSTCDTTGSG